ncbi:hypothetical protein PTI98_007339 [Pleurotus ostreatus]|nr:hypothetical protein PTI98_007339 [Pleurotus ostreatus]
MKHHEPRSSSRGAPQHMASLRSPTANPASPAAAVPSKSKSKSESLMISDEGLDVTAVATVRGGSSSTDRFSHSISKPSSSLTLRASSSSSQTAASSTRASPSTKKSRTLETDAQRSSMVRSAVTRSHSASASTSPVGPRPPSSHKFPSMTQSSWGSPSTPAKERLQKQSPTHTSVASSPQRPSTASSAPSSTTKSHSFSTPSPHKTAANSRNGRPSTAAALSSPSEPISTPLTRGRSGTVIATPSSAPSTSYSHSQLLSPSSPSGSPQAHSLLSSPLSSMLVSTPLSRSHRLSTTSEVSPVHLKRLLAEPAGASCSSAYGSGSENEVLGAGAGSFQRKRLGQGSDSEGYKSAPGGLGSGSRNAELKGRQRWLAKMQKSFDEDDESKPDELTKMQPALRLVQSLDTPPSSPPADPAAAKGVSSAELDGSGKEKKTRNVLKRRPSAGFSFLRRPATSSGTTTLKSSGNFLPSPVTLSPLPISPGLLHSPGMSNQSRSPSRDGSERSASRSGPASVNSLPPRSLTPAALLALEYREQEARREDIVDGVSETLRGSPSHPRHGTPGSDGSLRGHDRKRNLTAGDEEAGAEPGTPYYTVFGSRSGRVVAVGSPYDAWGYDVDAEHVRGRDKSINAGCGGRRGRSLDGRGGQSGSSKTTLGGVGRTLQRKVSGRFRGEKGISKDAEESGDTKGREGGMKKEQEKFTFGAHKRRSLRLSIDKFAEPDPAAMPAWPASPRQPIVDEGPELQRVTEDTRRKTEPGFLGGGKIWKLMKRLSTGGLREKYAEAPPPVPALPKELLGRIALGSNDAAHTQDPKGLDLSRLASRQSSASAPDPPLKKHASAVAKLSNTGAVVFAPRPSLNTRSSSPVSSELASLRFFRSNQSARSSTSSLFEDDDPPPLPIPSMISQHIIPPSEFNRADTSEESVDFRKDKVITKKPSLPLKIPEQRPSRSLSNDWLPTKSPYEEIKPSLPLPPRRTKGEQKSSRPPSPIIPSFSTVSPVNDFAPRKPSLKPQRPSTQPPSAPQIATVSASMGSSAPLLSTPPPPRPSRSMQRPSPNASASSSRVASPTRSKAEPHPSIDIKLETPDPPRLSLGSQSAASTSKTSHQRSSSPTSRRRTMVYKNMSAAQKSPMLTDKEKDDKWNDLLERSARAGGTLHIGGAELLSDRLSTLSMDIKHKHYYTHLYELTYTLLQLFPISL